MTRKEHLFIITKMLIVLSAIAIGILGIVFAIAFLSGSKFMVSWSCLMFGIIGGFVSIQTRLNKFETKDLELLSENIFQLLLVPIYGGIFAGILYLLFLSEILKGSLFPEFQYIISDPELDINTWITNILLNTYPKTTQDFAKLFIWSFIAGFSERFVPQVISSITKISIKETE